jgi:hypothetical protein
VGEVADHGGERSKGVSILDDLRVNMSRDDVARYLAGFGAGSGYDSATRRLLGVTGGHIDLHVEEHRLALIDWLRAWGCRHLRRADTPRTSEALRTWWEAWAVWLPDEQVTLNGLSQAGLMVAGQAFDALRASPAAARNVNGRDIAVTFGDTAAAKAMFAIRPRVFLPWDASIRLAFGWPGGGAAYIRLLQLSAAALDGLAGRLAASVADLPELLGRPASSPPKLVDEFLLIRVAKGP